jgi:hypothetical protein
MKYVINKNILWKKVDDEIVMVDPKKDDYSYLNSTATDVWVLIDKGSTSDEIIAKLAQDYEMDPKIVKTDVTKLLKELVKEGYITALK